MQKDGPYVGFKSVDFGVNSDISVGEDGLRLGECMFRQSCSFLYFCDASGIWSYCEAQVLGEPIYHFIYGFLMEMWVIRFMHGTTDLS